ncbi:MAG: NAD(P)/FAD-dependent oxidoreductase [Elusimicrobia bacterium]|nr:NAD(P)/FAD-dependent oxidoreductase [Elusimicrobiota bacterium]
MDRPRVVIVGAGFGGLRCARSLSGAPADVLLLDRNNYHLFAPLLYQVASSLLNPSDIAYPIRAVFRDGGNVRFRMAEATGADLDAGRVQLSDGSAVPYDYLVLAAGSETNFFGLQSVGRSAWGMKDLPEALALRNHVLRCFESAAREPSAHARAPWLTFVVAGGGPTGVEYAGALAELVRLVLGRDYPELSAGDVRILLVEGLDRLFPTFPPALGEKARARLESLGVAVRLRARVLDADADRVRLSDGEAVPARTLVWAAGVKAAGLAAALHAPRSRSGRIEVDEFLRVKGRERVYAIGDLASFQQDGREIPMIAAPAMQQARHAAGNIRASLEGRPPAPFHYKDRGMMATIGRNAAVAQIGRLSLAGFAGWIAWLFVHLYFLIGFRNRLVVLLGWAWNYLRHDRPIRLITRAGDRD